MLTQHTSNFKRVRAVVKTPRRVYTTLAGNSLFWQSLPDLAELADNVFLSLALSAVVSNVNELQTIGRIFEWLLIAYLIYRLLSRLLPSGGPVDVFQEPYFKLLIILIATGFRYFMNIIVTDGASAETGWSFIGSVILSWYIFSTYVYHRRFDNSPGTARIKFAEEAVPGGISGNEYEKFLNAQNKDGYIKIFSTIGLVAGSTAWVVVLCLLLGMGMTAANALFPLLEVLLIFFLGSSVLAERLPGSRGEWLTDSRQPPFDIEGQIYLFLRYISTSAKGMIMVIYVVFGYFLTVIYLDPIVFTDTPFVLSPHIQTVEMVTPGKYPSLSPIVRWNFFGAVICVALSVLYALWFWFVETIRLPHYLEYWQQSHPEGAPITAPKELPPLMTRPPGFLLPTLPPWFLASLFLEGGREFSLLSHLLSVESRLYALAWPLVVIGVLANVRWTLNNDPQPSRTDSHAILAAVVVQFVLTPSLGRYDIILALIIYFYYMSDISLYLKYNLEVERPEMITMIVLSFLFIIIGFAFNILSPVGIDTLGIVMVVVGMIFCVINILILISSILDENSTL